MQNAEDVLIAKNMGFTNASEVPDEGLRIGGMNICKTPAIHGDNVMVAQMMGEVHGYYITGEDKSLYIAGDTVMCDAVSEFITKTMPDVITLNCCEATLPIGRLIMNLDDIDSVCELVPDALVIATHLESVNHALLSRSDVRKYIDFNKLSQVIVPDDGEIISI
ncbi:MAG: hypothetical protein Q4E53_13895 [Eubacteriales bacterium]|nr:hypothetical protein [Eubacteriales bacterium]